MIAMVPDSKVFFVYGVVDVIRKFIHHFVKFSKKLNALEQWKECPPRALRYKRAALRVVCQPPFRKCFLWTGNQPVLPEWDVGWDTNEFQLKPLSSMLFFVASKRNVQLILVARQRVVQMIYVTMRLESWVRAVYANSSSGNHFTFLSTHGRISNMCKFHRKIKHLFF